MNIIVGMISPETNWAPKLTRNSSSFSSAKVRSTSRLPVEDLDQRVAGEGLLDLAVELAGAAPLLDELALRALHDRARHVDRDRHGHQRDHRQQRRDPDHHRQHRDHGHQRGHQLAHRLLEGLADVVDVVGDPAQQLAARRPVEVAERQPVDLVLDVLAHPVDGVLDDAVEHAALQPAEQRGGGVHREHQQQHVADGAEVDAPAGHHVVHRGEHRRRACPRRARGGPAPPAPG